MIRFFRKIIRKVKVLFFGRCHIKGHNWKMKKGWGVNPKWNVELGFNQKESMAKPLVYYRCKRCGAVAFK